jgi:hypothetical protein
MSYASVQLAIEVQLASVLANKLVQWPNGPIIKPAGQAYADVFHLPGSMTVATLGTSGTDAIIGITQVDVYTPIASGNNEGAALVDTFRASFYAGKWLTHNSQSVLIINCGPGPASRDNAYYKSSIEITWEARIAR